MRPSRIASPQPVTRGGQTHADESPTDAAETAEEPARRADDHGGGWLQRAPGLDCAREQRRVKHHEIPHLRGGVSRGRSEWGCSDLAEHCWARRSLFGVGRQRCR